MFMYRSTSKLIDSSASGSCVNNAFVCFFVISPNLSVRSVIRIQYCVGVHVSTPVLSGCIFCNFVIYLQDVVNHILNNTEENHSGVGRTLNWSPLLSVFECTYLFPSYMSCRELFPYNIPM